MSLHVKGGNFVLKLIFTVSTECPQYVKYLHITNIYITPSLYPVIETVSQAFFFPDMPPITQRLPSEQGRAYMRQVNILCRREGMIFNKIKTESYGVFFLFCFLFFF